MGKKSTIQIWLLLLTAEFDVPFFTQNIETNLKIFSQSEAPGLRNIEEAKNCVHNVLRSHAKTYHLYDRIFRKQQHGKIGMLIFTQWFEAKNQSNPSHVKMAEFAVQITVNYLFSYRILSVLIN